MQAQPISVQTPVAVIGLGSMGLGVAFSLQRAGFIVHGVDIRAEARRGFQEKGGLVFASPMEAAAEAGAVFLFVVDAGQVEEALFGFKGALDSARPGTVFLLCPTMPPDAAIEIAARLERAALLVLDAPVSGGAGRAHSGELTVMASGSEAAFARSEPLLAAIASRCFRLGDRAGAGSRMKMINQLLAGVHIAATAEALTLAQAEGLDLKTVYDIVRVSAGSSWMFENRGAHIIAGDYAPLSAVEVFVKDLSIVVSEAEAVKAETPLTGAALALFKEAAKAGLGRLDDSAVAMVLARRAGVRLPGMEV